MLDKVKKSFHYCVRTNGYIKGISLFFFKVFCRNRYHEKIITKLQELLYEEIHDFQLNHECDILRKNDKNFVWFFWYQGSNCMPEIIKKTYRNACEYFEQLDKVEVVLLTESNIEEYVKFPQVINKKFTEGKITITHYSDILRAALLEQYGGCWLDATCLIIDEIPSNLFECEFYTGKIKESKFFNNGKWTGFFMAGYANNPVFAFLKKAFYKYWIEYDEMLDYYLIDYILEAGYRNVPCVRKYIDAVEYNNTEIMYVCENWNQIIDAQELTDILKEDWVVKMSWKDALSENKNTVSNIILDTRSL